MKALTTLIRLHQRRLDEQRVRLVELEIKREALRDRAQRLAAEVEAEGRVAAMSFEASRSFPPYAGRVRAEQSALAAEAAGLDAAIAEAGEAVAAAYQELKTYQISRDRRGQRRRAAEARRDQAHLDEVGITVHRRKHAG